MGTSEVEAHDDAKQSPAASEETRTAHWLLSRRGPAFFDPIVRLLDPSERRIGPYIKKGQVVADLGCGWGHSSFALADMVGPEGKVYSVDLARKCIRVIRRRAEQRGCHNIEAHVSSAADLSFIPDGSVDFVFANGLLCSMRVDRQLAVNEMKRILKPAGMAYVSLGSAPPFGYVNRAEWEGILAGFRIERGGSFEKMWALVSARQKIERSSSVIRL